MANKEVIVQSVDNGFIVVANIDHRADIELTRVVEDGDDTEIRLGQAVIEVHLAMADKVKQEAKT